MFTVTYGQYTLIVDHDGLPTEERSAFFRVYADLYERFTLHGEDVRTCFVAVRHNVSWWPALPFLVVQQEYKPMKLADPGVLFVPETGRMFIGAGRRLLAYQLEEPKRLWEAHVDEEFFSWQRHGNVVVMAAQDELAAWDLNGEKLWWTTEPEHQWSYSVEEDIVTLEIGGRTLKFSLEEGPRE